MGGNTVGMWRLEVNKYKAFLFVFLVHSCSSFLLSAGVTAAVASKKKENIFKMHCPHLAHGRNVYVWKCHEPAVRKNRSRW